MFIRHLVYDCFVFWGAGLLLNCIAFNIISAVYAVSCAVQRKAFFSHVCRVWTAKSVWKSLYLYSAITIPIYCTLAFKLYSQIKQIFVFVFLECFMMLAATIKEKSHSLSHLDICDRFFSSNHNNSWRDVGFVADSKVQLRQSHMFIQRMTFQGRVSQPPGHRRFATLHNGKQ